MDQGIIKQLKKIVGPDHVSTAREDLLCYSYDSSGVEYLPEAVAFPGTTGEVSAIMSLAAREIFPVVPRGAGTGMTGGALAAAGGLVLVMSRLNRILEIDRDNMVAVVEPGVITGQLQDEVSRQGLYYPPDPASLKFCTIGGNVGNGAGGPSAVKYGVTRDYVLGLEVVLPDGTILNTGVRTAKGVVGYDLTRLFVGSEGTLGIITRIILRLIALPAAKKSFLVFGRDLARITRLVAMILSEGILPCTLEYMDRTAINIVASSLPFTIPEAAAALLLIELDGDHETVAVQSGKLMRFLAQQADLLEIREAKDEKEREKLWMARRSISPAAFQLKPHKISEDVVVPRSKIPELVDFAEKLSRETGLPILTFGHAGDGNIHVNIMLDRNDPGELAKGNRAKEKIFHHVLGLAGTLSGEHGIGSVKAPYLPLELHEENIRVMRAVKKLFDPLNILNPGKMLLDKK